MTKKFYIFKIKLFIIKRNYLFNFNFFASIFYMFHKTCLSRLIYSWNTFGVINSRKQHINKQKYWYIKISIKANLLKVINNWNLH